MALENEDLARQMAEFKQNTDDRFDVTNQRLDIIDARFRPLEDIAASLRKIVDVLDSIGPSVRRAMKLIKWVGAPIVIGALAKIGSIIVEAHGRIW